MPQIPAGWKETTLGNLIYSGEIQIKNFLRKPISSNERSKIQWEYPYYWAASSIDSLNSFSLEGLHLLIAEDWTVVTNKNSPMLQLVDGKFNVSNHAHILQGNDNQKTRFLYYLLSNVNVLPYITWAVQPKLSKENLLKICFLIPESLPEQQAIAAVLSSFDDKIELLRAENQTLEQMGQELFKERFGAPQPPKGGAHFSHPAEGGSHSQALRAEGKSPLGEGWRVGKLGEIAEITSWKRPSEISDTRNSLFEIPLIWATKIMGYVQNFLFDGETLVIGRVWTHWEVQIFYEKIHPSDNTLVIKSNNFYFTYFILKSIDYEKINRGAVQPLITQSDLKNYLVILPDQETLSKFDLVIKPLFNKIRANSEQIQSLSATRDQLLPKLMSGEVRVEF